MEISIFGLGYVGLANALLLDTKYQVTAYDINIDRIKQLQERKSPIEDELIEDFLLSSNVKFTVDLDKVMGFDCAIIATPTNYDENHHFFDTSSIENVIDKIVECRDDNDFIIVIKSTIPIGYIKHLRDRYPNISIVFSPEFLREGQALKDNLYPSRIIVGDRSAVGEKVSKLFYECALNNPEILLMDSMEAESVKLFANSYLAMRVAFMNELDTFALEKGLDTSSIIRGIGLDKRIGLHYNNPSFGYGGYCLPKDSKQLESNYQSIPQKLITAIVQSNDVRKNYLVDKILEQKPKIIGVYRLSMKASSDNFRQSSIIDIIERLQKLKISIIIYEPQLPERQDGTIKITHNIDEIKQGDIILANRISEEISDVKNKLFSRDIFHDN